MTRRRRFLTTAEQNIAAKAEGQAQSLLDVLDELEGRYMHVIDEVPPGTLFSVNRVRSRLDEVGVPEKARAALFVRATAVGLITAVTVPSPVGEVPVTEPSTGASAHHAHVRVYARTALHMRQPVTAAPP